MQTSCRMLVLLHREQLCQAAGRSLPMFLRFSLQRVHHGLQLRDTARLLLQLLALHLQLSSLGL